MSEAHELADQELKVNPVGSNLRLHVLNIRQQCLPLCSQGSLEVILDSLHLCLLCMHKGAADLHQGRIVCYVCTIPVIQVRA